jgi:hypothetical protein
MTEQYRFAFKHPTTIVLAGPTQSGKTYFLVEAMLQHRIDPMPQRIVWVFGEWQPLYEVVQKAFPHVEFVKDYSKQLYESFAPNVRNMLILDDQMENKMATKRGDNGATKFFTQGSHHRNLTIVYIVQNLFNQDPAMRTISLNTQYMVLFKNVRDTTQIRLLGRQMYMNADFLADCYKDATSRPHGYLLIVFHKDMCDNLRILTNVLGEDGNEYPTAYVPTNDLAGRRVNNSGATANCSGF